MTRPALPLDPNRLALAQLPIEKASTLPVEAYANPTVYREEEERLFRGGWLCAGRVDQVSNPGDYFAIDLLEERLVVCRDSARQIRVMSRICRHRGAEVASGSGNTRSFQCPYHLWTYHLDGRLAGAPHMETAESFDKAQCRLPELKSEIWEGWIFVNLDGEASPLGPQLEPLSKLLAGYRMSELVAVETAVFDSPFNWKVLVDNFMEAYHHTGTHRNTLQPFLPGADSHSPDNDGPYSALVMPAIDRFPDGGLVRSEALEPWQEQSLVAAVVFPFHLFAPSPESLAWYQILPESWNRFTLRIYSCFAPEALERAELREAVTGVGDLTRAVHLEDVGACESVWAGLQSRHFAGGRMSTLERSIWQFNQWWIAQMGLR